MRSGTEESRLRWWDTEERIYGRDWVLQRLFAHDVYHCAELNETLGIAGPPQIDLWGLIVVCPTGAGAWGDTPVVYDVRTG